MNTEQIRKLWEAYVEVSEKKEQKLDPVNDKELDKKFKDRTDKDIDNDGDVDSSDEYLHNRRKAVDKAIEKEKGKGKTAEISKIGEAKMDDSEVLSAAKKLAANGKDEKAKKFGQGLVDFYNKNDSFTPDQVAGLQNIMKNASFQLAKEEVELDESAVLKKMGERIGEYLGTFVKDHPNNKLSRMLRKRFPSIKRGAAAARAFYLDSAAKDAQAILNLMSDMPQRELFGDDVDVEKFEKAKRELAIYTKAAKKYEKMSEEVELDESAVLKKMGERIGEYLSTFVKDHPNNKLSRILRKRFPSIKRGVAAGRAFYLDSAAKDAQAILNTMSDMPQRDLFGDDVDVEEFERVKRELAIYTKAAKKYEKMSEETELDEAKMSVGDTVRVNPKSKNIVDRQKLGKSGYIKSVRGKDYLVKFADGSSILAQASDLEMVKEDTLGEAFEMLWNAIQEAAEPKNRKANATAPEGIMDKESPKSKEFADKHKQSQKEYEEMPQDAVDKTTEAGRGVKSQAPSRPGDNKSGDKTVVKPVKEDTRSEREKIMDILSGKTWNEAKEAIKNLDEEVENLDESLGAFTKKIVARFKSQFDYQDYHFDLAKKLVADTVGSNSPQGKKILKQHEKLSILTQYDNLRPELARERLSKNIDLLYDDIKDAEHSVKFRKDWEAGAKETAERVAANIAKDEKRKREIERAKNM